MILPDRPTSVIFTVRCSHFYQGFANIPEITCAIIYVSPVSCQRSKLKERHLEIRLPASGREWCPGCHPERSEGSLCPSRRAALIAVLADVMLSAAKHLRGGVTSRLFAALTAVLEDLLHMLLSKCLAQA
jgi:hypothetical protein